MKGIYSQATQQQALAVCSQVSAVQRLIPWRKTCVRRVLVLLSVPLQCVDFGSCWLLLPYSLKVSTRCAGLGLLGSAGQGQLLPIPCPGPMSMRHKAIFRWLLPMGGLEVPGKGQATNQSWLQVVPDLSPLYKTYRVCQRKILLICGLLTLERF